MVKVAISIILLMSSISLYSESINDALGIDLNQAIHLLGTEPPKSTPSKPEPEGKPKQEKATTECALPGKVIKVVDGDTVYVLDDKKAQHKIRIAGIDAPEKGQPYSKAATKYLKSQVAGKEVCVEWHKRDRYRRLVGVVHYDNKDINY